MRTLELATVSYFFFLDKNSSPKSPHGKINNSKIVRTKMKKKENGEDRDKVYYETLSDASQSTLGSPTASPALAQARPSVTRFLESASALPSSLELRWDSTSSLMICKKCYKLIPRTPLARRVRRTPMATMQSRVVRSAAVAPRGQMGT